MFIDASALVALLVVEDGVEDIEDRFQSHETRATSPLSIWECVVAVARIMDLPPTEAAAEVRGFCDSEGIEILPVPAEAAALAIDAWARFGKGRHPAGLNFGDCFSYACARHYGLPLLYKGSDFALTDIEAA